MCRGIHAHIYITQGGHWQHIGDVVFWWCCLTWEYALSWASYTNMSAHRLAGPLLLLLKLSTYSDREWATFAASLGWDSCRPTLFHIWCRFYVLRWPVSVTLYCVSLACCYWGTLGYVLCDWRTVAPNKQRMRPYISTVYIYVFIGGKDSLSKCVCLLEKWPRCLPYRHTRYEGGGSGGRTISLVLH